MSAPKMTPEQHTNDLIAAIDRELDRFGAVSLADFVASTIDGRVDDERADYVYWTEVREVFEAARDRLQALNRSTPACLRERGDDDGVEYADPRDEQDERRKP